MEVVLPPGMLVPLALVPPALVPPAPVPLALLVELLPGVEVPEVELDEPVLGVRLMAETGTRTLLLFIALLFPETRAYIREPEPGSITKPLTFPTELPF